MVAWEDGAGSEWELVALETPDGVPLSMVLRFDGPGHIVDVGVKPQHKPRRDITVEAWVFATRQQQWAGIVSRIFDTGSTESGYGLLLDGASGVYFGLRTTSNQNFYFSSGPDSLKLNTWQHVAATYDGHQIVIYVDGQPRATATMSGDLDFDPENSLTIGAYRDNDELHAFPGKIAEVRLWGVARGAEQIRGDMHRRLRGDEPGMLGYWPLDEGGWAVARDRTANALHGAITGATWETSPLPVGTIRRGGKPNVLLIIADDCGVDLLRINARGEVVAQLDGPDGKHVGGQRLPNIERLVKHGVRFTHAWAHPVCAPSRASVFTGLHPWRHGVGFPSEDCVLPATRPHTTTPIHSLAEVVGPAGYRCGMFGKWDLGGPEPGHKRTAADWGWTHFEGIIGGGLRPQKVLKYGYPPAFEAGADVIKLETLDSTEVRPGAPPNVLEERRQVRAKAAEYLKQAIPDYMHAQRDIRYYVAKKDYEDRETGVRRYDILPTERTHMYVTKDHFYSARDWIARHGDEPWFVAMTSIAPHDPYHIPPQESFTIKFADPNRPTTQELLVAMVQSLDYYVGALLDAPELRAQLENTVIVFVSDNGTQDDDPDSRSADGKGELVDDDQQDKGTHYIGGCHVPLVIADGGALFAGAPIYLDPELLGGGRSVHDSPVHIVDLFATVAEIAGASPPADLDSVSLVPHLRRSPGQKRAYNFSQQFAPFGGKRIAIHASISDGRYKLSCVRSRVVDGVQADDYAYSLSMLREHESIPGALRETILEAYEEDDDHVDALRRLYTELERHRLTPGSPPQKVEPLKFPKLQIAEVAAYRYVRLVALSEVNGKPWTAVADFNVLVDGRPLDRSNWTVTTDSAEADAPGQAAIDPKRPSIWHTAWRSFSPPHPHWLAVDLGSPQKITGFKYQPHSDMPDGRIAQYEFQVSNDGENWTTVVAGKFPNTALEQTVSVLAPNRKIRRPPGARFVRLVARSEVAGNPWTSVEDLYLLVDGVALDRSDWSVSCDSQETAAEPGHASHAIDGSPGTIWHTQWSSRSPRHPHWLCIDMQVPQNITGFRYQPRRNGRNGRIADYELQVSQDGQHWTSVAAGRFPDTAEAQTVAVTLPPLF